MPPLSARGRVGIWTLGIQDSVRGLRSPVALDRRQLENLRTWRLGAPKDLSLTADLTSLVQGVKRQTTRFAGLGEAWQALCPAHLSAGTTILSLSRGVLSVRAPDAAARFALDRWLRDGGETELIKRCPTLLRVRLVA